MSSQAKREWIILLGLGSALLCLGYGWLWRTRSIEETRFQLAAAAKALPQYVFQTEGQWPETWACLERASILQFQDDGEFAVQLPERVEFASFGPSADHIDPTLIHVDFSASHDELLLWPAGRPGWSLATCRRLSEQLRSVRAGFPLSFKP